MAVGEPGSTTLNAAIARECARIRTRYVGRGPRKTRVIVRSDLVLVLMEDTMTTADKSLLAAGKANVVEQVRAEFQSTMEPELVEVVERLTGATVRAFMSAGHLDPDMAVEVFVLTPRTGSPHVE